MLFLFSKSPTPKFKPASSKSFLCTQLETRSNLSLHQVSKTLIWLSPLWSGWPQHAFFRVDVVWPFTRDIHTPISFTPSGRHHYSQFTHRLSALWFHQMIFSGSWCGRGKLDNKCVSCVHRPEPLSCFTPSSCPRPLPSFLITRCLRGFHESRLRFSLSLCRAKRTVGAHISVSTKGAGSRCKLSSCGLPLLSHSQLQCPPHSTPPPSLLCPPMAKLHSITLRPLSGKVPAGETAGLLTDVVPGFVILKSCFSLWENPWSPDSFLFPFIYGLPRDQQLEIT